MDGRLGYTLVLLLLLDIRSVLGACSIPPAWQERWLWDWALYQQNRVFRYLEITDQGYNRTLKVTQVSPDQQIMCDNTLANGAFTVFSGHDVTNSTRRICVQGHQSTDMLLWRETWPPPNPTAYSANDCLLYMVAPVVSWRYLRKYPLKSSNCPIPRGTYQTVYSESPSKLNQCVGDQNSVTTVDRQTMTVNSCSRELSSYEKPFNTILNCASDWSASVLGAPARNGDFIAVSRLDLLDNVYNYYCGRYRIDQSTAQVFISLYKSDKYYSVCEVDKSATYVSDRHVAFVLQSTACNSGPCNNGGTCTDRVGDFVCTCPTGYTGKTCSSRIDFCAGSPCKNGATCTSDLSGYRCSCTAGYSGPECTDRDWCFGNPCQNGGTCSDAPGGSTYQCACPLGYTGGRCETDIDYCAGIPCKNGGQCIERQSWYECRCTQDYVGPTCEISNPCTPNPCQNNGQCEPKVSQGSAVAECACVAPYSGDRCQTELNACDSQPCQNGATCLRDGYDYQCGCPEGYTGKNCDVFNPCLRSPCLNAATCRPTGGLNYECQCSALFTGLRCQVPNPCGSSPCLNGGACFNNGSDFYCECPNTYNGTTCDSPVTAAQEGTQMYTIVIVLLSILGAAFVCVICVVVIACIARRMRKEQEKYNDRLSEVRTLTKGSTRGSTYLSSLTSDRGSTWYPSYKSNGSMSSLNKKTGETLPVS